MSRTDPQFKLRMPPALRDLVERSAKAAHRSLNAELVVRLQQSFAQEVPADDRQQLSAHAAPRELRLLCLLVPSRRGEPRSLPVHTLRRLPPYASLSGRYHDGEGRGSVALDPLDLPGGTGLYLRETHARTPSAAVLARCLRQRPADALRPRVRTVRAGGLSHA